jgi:hypothetical protein
LNFLDRFSKNTQTLNLIKIRPVGAELFHVDGQMGGQRYVQAKVAFRNFANAKWLNSTSKTTNQLVRLTWE